MCLIETQQFTLPDMGNYLTFAHFKFGSYVIFTVFCNTSSVHHQQLLTFGIKSSLISIVAILFVYSNAAWDFLLKEGGGNFLISVGDKPNLDSKLGGIEAPAHM